LTGLQVFSKANFLTDNPKNMPTANINGALPTNTWPGQNNLTRTNPYAEESNAEYLLGFQTNQARHSIAFNWQVSGAGTQVRFTPSTGATTATNIINFTVTDESGNEANATGFQSSAATTVLVVNTSALNRADVWKVTYFTSNGTGTSETKVGFDFEIPSAAIFANSSAAVSYTLS
jgi:hypothetical protein